MRTARVGLGSANREVALSTPDPAGVPVRPSFCEASFDTEAFPAPPETAVSPAPFPAGITLRFWLAKTRLRCKIGVSAAGQMTDRRIQSTENIKSCILMHYCHFGWCMGLQADKIPVRQSQRLEAVRTHVVADHAPEDLPLDPFPDMGRGLSDRSA